MLPISSPETARLAALLEGYALKETVSRVAGLLTIPKLHASTLRLEVLVHLAVAKCNGKKKPDHRQLRRWLNDYLGKSIIASQEDPTEDVFILNLETLAGNCRLFRGIWEAPDYFLQVAIDILAKDSAPQKCKDLLHSAFELLRISEAVAERLKLKRWHSEESIAQSRMRISPVTGITKHSQAITFSNEDLATYQIDRDFLAPFLLSEVDRSNIASENIGHSSLERRPLLDFGDAFILALPTAVSPAIRRYLLEELNQLGYLDQFEKVLGAHQAHLIERNVFWEIRDKSLPIEPSSPDGGPTPSMHAWLLKYDLNKYLHVVLLHDHFDLLAKEGFASFLQYPKPVQEGLEQYVSKIASQCQSESDFSDGMTLFVFGGLGRGFSLGFKSWPEHWRFSTVRISDLIMLALNPDRPLERYLKFIKQRDWAEAEGIYFQSMDGDFNHYCYWIDTDFQLIPREMPVQQESMIALGCDCVNPIRTSLRKLADEHVSLTVIGKWVKVTKYGRESFYESIRERPIYVSMDHLSEGVLAAVVECKTVNAWLTIIPKKDDEQVRHLAYELWSGFLGLFDKAVHEVETLVTERTETVVEISLDLGTVVAPEDASDVCEEIKVETPVWNKSGSNKITVTLPVHLFSIFNQPQNIGERYILDILIRALLALFKNDEADQLKDENIEILLNKVIGDDGSRVLHFFANCDPVEYLMAHKNRNPVFLAHEDFVFSKLKLSDDCADDDLKRIISKDESKIFLCAVVDKIWNQIKEKLAQHNRQSVISELFHAHEAILYDREHWRRTAQALISLYRNNDEGLSVANKREADRTHTSLPIRALIEMAVCECSLDSGKPLPNWARDSLIAKAALLIEVATECDAIHYGLINPKITLHPNGEYTLQRDFQEKVINPFLSNYAEEQFRGAASRYGELYEQRSTPEKRFAEEMYSSAYISAFKAEFNLSVDEFVDCIAELFDLAIENDCVVVQTTLGEIRSRLISKRGMSASVIEAFLKGFALWHRKHWDHSPDGFKGKDIWPWKFKRRLSLTYRPITMFGTNEHNAVIYGIGGLKQGYANLLDRIEQGQLPQEFFQSAKMKEFLGSVVNEKGHAFAKVVADEFIQHGWHARNEVNMSELEAPPDCADGDVDVLAWRDSGEVLLVECKRLQLAMTVAEIGKICERFAGDAKDELAKHTRRVNWIRKNPDAIRRVVGFSPDVRLIDSRLITNTHVPMMYLDDLPYPAIKIGPLKWEGNEVKAIRGYGA